MDIPLAQGKVAHIDDEDWPLVAAYQWYAARDRGIWYAHATPLDRGRGRKMRMHHLILGSKWADHRDGNGLNNRRSNLRP